MKIFTMFAAFILGSRIMTNLKAQVPYITTSSFALPEKEKISIMAMANKVRATINPPASNMNALSYNTTLEPLVIKFLNAHNASWVFENSTQYNSTLGGPKNNWNGFVMLEDPAFRGWKPWCQFFVHDTNTTPNQVANIFHYRIKQTGCFVFSACDKYPQLENFLSCIPSLQTTQVNYICEYANDFFVRMLLNYDSFIVVGINNKGPYTPYPKTQLLSFWGWGCSSSGIADIPTNGYPYQAGKRTSQCDMIHPIAKNGLCYKS